MANRQQYRHLTDAQLIDVYTSNQRKVSGSLLSGYDTINDKETRIMNNARRELRRRGIAR